jgi:hypothetical protein
MMLLLWLLNAADVLTTRLVIEGGGVETNPLVASFAGSTWQLTLVKVAVLGAFTLLRPPPLYVTVLCGVYTGVVAWNVTQLAGW